MNALQKVGSAIKTFQRHFINSVQHVVWSRGDFVMHIWDSCQKNQDQGDHYFFSSDERLFFWLRVQ